jgi:hypothetical protein
MCEGSGMGVRCCRWYIRGGGWAKREAKAVRGANEDADGDVGAARRAGGGAGPARCAS